MTLDDKWFTEICEESGTAFSLRITAQLHEEQSDFQKIAIYETEKFGRLMAIDGFIMLSARDNFLYHEMLSHPVLYAHPNPQRVLIVGGGDCGTLREVLKHPEVKQAWQVDIDERVTRLSEQYFPELCESNHDPRATIHFADGIQWVKNAAPGSYDIIIVDSTDPIGPAEGLFGEAFYRDCHKALDINGILAQQSESPLLHQQLIRDMQTAMQNAEFTEVLTYDFPQPVYPSGWWSATMASKDHSCSEFREQDTRTMPFTTRYYHHGLHLATRNLTYYLDHNS